MKKLLLALILSSGMQLNAQSAIDLFQNSETQVYYLGIDFSHVKLIGEFAQAYGLGEQSLAEIRDDYFPAWNKVVINERDKYDIAGMLRRDRILYDIDMIMAQNKETDINALESYNEPNYTEEQIVEFVSAYPPQGKSGIGVLFIAEALNKASKEAIFHFTAISMQTGEVLFTKRMYGTPSGFGIRNYWAGSVYSIIKQIETYEYRKWQLAHTE